MDEPDVGPAPVEVIADAPPADRDEDIEDEPQPSFNDDGPVHRPLIRAQLPRVEGVKVERQAPDFTIRQNAGRGGNGHARGHQNNNNGQRFGRGPHRGGGRDGGGRDGRGGFQGFGGGRPQRSTNKRGR